MSEQREKDNFVSSSAKKSADQEKQERDKKLILWSGVIFFMLLISFFWVINFRKNFTYVKTSPDSFEWSQIGGNLNKATEGIKNILDELSIEQPSNQIISQEGVDQLKEDLEKNTIVTSTVSVNSSTTGFPSE